jgi:carbonic anhydrase
MNAEDAIKTLLEGNKRYMSGELEPKDVKSKREATKAGQKPIVTVVCCSDSRVVPEYIFNTNLEEIFAIMTAGNVIEAGAALGTVEYGVAHLHTPVLMVLGHEKCGAVTAACSGHREGNITKIMKMIEPVIAGVEKSDDQNQHIINCARANVKTVMKSILDNSEIVRKAVESGETKLVGAMYYLEDGRVEILE